MELPTRTLRTPPSAWAWLNPKKISRKIFHSKKISEDFFFTKKKSPKNFSLKKNLRGKFFSFKKNSNGSLNEFFSWLECVVKQMPGERYFHRPCTGSKLWGAQRGNPQRLPEGRRPAPFKAPLKRHFSRKYFAHFFLRTCESEAFSKVESAEKSSS